MNSKQLSERYKDLKEDIESKLNEMLTGNDIYFTTNALNKTKFTNDREKLEKLIEDEEFFDLADCGFVNCLPEIYFFDSSYNEVLGNVLSIENKVLSVINTDEQELNLVSLSNIVKMYHKISLIREIEETNKQINYP